jgi:hypothetical protein
MTEPTFSRVREFYTKYLPLGDRLGEMFYAVWMVVVSLGILGGTGFEGGAIAYVVLIAFMVNITWGLIDGITVMYSGVIERRRIDGVIHDLQTANDESSRKAGAIALGDGITSILDPTDRERVLDMIVASKRGEDPQKTRYRPGREDWYYALGILVIDIVLVVPLIAPFFMFQEPATALQASRFIATVIFAGLGAAYARELNRNRWIAALFLGTLCLSLFSLVYMAGWGSFLLLLPADPPDRNRWPRDSSC